jgi:thioesterase
MTRTLPARPAIQNPASAAMRWFPAAELPSTAPLRMICLSFAGGTPSVFRGWPRLLGPDVDLIRVLRPGRRTRLGGEPFAGAQPLVEAVTDALVAADLARDYAVFGHGRGALAGYEVSCELRRRGYPEPLHLFVSGSKAPQLFGREALGCPVTAFRGSADPVATAAHVQAWRESSSGPFVQRTLPGDHFFLTGARQLVLGHLRAELDRIRPDVRHDVDDLYLKEIPA